MSYDRPTVKDVRRIFEQYEELVKEYDLIRSGYNLALEEGSKTYGRAYRVYEVADRSLWGKKGDSNSHDGQYGSGHYEPTIGQNYLGMTAAEACEALITRKRMVYDMAEAWKIKKTNPILDCGHFPIFPGQKTIDAEGKTLCYSCADERTRDDLKTADRTTLYVSSFEPDNVYVSNLTNWNVTTWNGTPMGRIIESSSECVNYTPSGGRYSFYSITVKMEDGSLWYGLTEGPGMYVNLKRKKVSK